MLGMDMIAPFLFLLLIVGILVILPILLLILSKDNRFGGVRAKSYGTPSVTDRGEVVRSVGEKIIANYFYKNNINYAYEPHQIGWAIPDFYLPDFNVYVEFWGLVNADDDWTRKRYVREMKRKMAMYYKRNVRFVSIYPDNIQNLDWIFRTKFRETTGYNLPN
jgi:hypothetical protein